MKKWMIFMDIIKSLNKSGLLLKDFTETIENEAKKQKGGFLGMLLGIIGTSLLGNFLTGKGVRWLNIPRRRVMLGGESTIRNDERTIRAGQLFNLK